MDRMDNSELSAIIMTSMMMHILSKRKGRAPAPVDIVEEAPVTNTISAEERAEMERCPRAYKRRQLKLLRKGKL